MTYESRLSKRERILTILGRIWIFIILLIDDHRGLVKGDCPLDTFPCGNGDCIDKRFVCDMVIDCRRNPGEIEGRDELDCSTHENYCPDESLRRLPDSALSKLTDTGYNVVRGGFANVRMFQSERYVDGCQTVHRRLDDGTMVSYRLPQNLLNWTFFDDISQAVGRIEFKLDVFESGYDAYTKLKNQRILIDPQRPDQLTLSFRGQFMGDRSDSFYDTLRQNRQIEHGYPTVRVSAEIRTGQYRLNPPDELALHKDFFAPQLLQAVKIVEDDTRSNGSAAEHRLWNIFRRTGTHYVSEGTFGGVYELFVHRGDCQDEARGQMDGVEARNPVAYLDIQDIGDCIQGLMRRQFDADFPDNIPTWTIPECLNVTSAMTSRIAPRKYNFQTKAYVSGGDPTLEKGLETAALVLDLPSILPTNDFKSWIRTLNDFPTPVDIRLVPICDLITERMTDSWAKARTVCVESLLSYIRSCDQEGDQASNNCAGGVKSSRRIPLVPKYSFGCPPTIDEDCLPRRQSFGSCPYQSDRSVSNGGNVRFRTSVGALLLALIVVCQTLYGM